MSKSRPLVRGTLILGSVNLFNRGLGIVSQALAIRILGTEGYGLYQLSVPIFLLFLVLATAGIPLAVTRLVADEQARGNHTAISHIVRWAITWLSLLGFSFSILIAALWPLITRYILADPRARWCLLVLGLSLPVTTAASALRAYFQGLQRMEVPALAQMVEQSVRVFAGLYLAYTLRPYGVPWAAAGYAAGTILGESAGLLIMLGLFLKRQGFNSWPSFRPSVPSSSRSFKEKIAPLAGPATLNRLLSAMVLNVEAVLIPRCLEASGYSLEQSTSLYGQFMGVALTLVSIPSIATMAISTNLLPAVASASSRQDNRYLLKSVGQSIRVVIALSLPVTVALWLVPQEITYLLFGLVGDTEYISILALGGIGLYLIQITNGILYGLNAPWRVLGNTLVYSLVRITCIYLLVPLGGGLVSLALSYLTSYLAGTFLNLYPLRFYLQTDKPPRLKSLVLAAALMFITVMTVKTHTLRMEYETTAVLAAVLGTGLVVYVLTAVMSELYFWKRLRYDDTQ